MTPTRIFVLITIVETACRWTISSITKLKCSFACGSTGKEDNTGSGEMARYLLFPTPFVLLPAESVEFCVDHSFLARLPLRWGKQIVAVQWLAEGYLYPVGVLASLEVEQTAGSYVRLTFYGEHRYRMVGLRQRWRDRQLEVSIELLPDREEVPHRELERIVERLHQQLLQVLPGGAVSRANRGSGKTPLSYRLATYWMEDLASRQHLLELRSEIRRLQLLRAHLQNLVEHMSTEQQWRWRLKGN